MLSRRSARFAARAGFSVGVVMTTPPFPYSRKEVHAPVGLPVLLPGSFTPEDLANIHYGEVGLEGSQLVTSGLYGWSMVVTGTGPTIAAAQRAAYGRAGQILIPNVRYRLDIGERLIASDYAALEAMSIFSAA